MTRPSNGPINLSNEFNTRFGMYHVSVAGGFACIFRKRQVEQTSIGFRWFVRRWI